MKTSVRLWSYLAQFSSKLDVFQKLYRNLQRTFTFNTFQRKSCCYEKKNVEKFGRARQDTNGNTIRYKGVAWRIIKATHTECNKYYFSKATTFKRTGFNVTLHANCIPCSLLVLFLAKVPYSELFCVAKFYKCQEQNTAVSSIALHNWPWSQCV